jgi:hypothetical protein
MIAGGNKKPLPVFLAGELAGWLLRFIRDVTFFRAGSGRDASDPSGAA